MRLAGLGTGTVLVSCLAVMAVGLLGGPKAPFIPWSALHQDGGSGGAPAARQAGRAATPTPDVKPLSPAPRRSTAQPAGSPGGSPSAATGVTPSPMVTNRASKAPPGLNRTPSPKHTGVP